MRNGVKKTILERLPAVVGDSQLVKSPREISTVINGEETWTPRYLDAWKQRRVNATTAVRHRSSMMSREAITD